VQRRESAGRPPAHWLSAARSSVCSGGGEGIPLLADIGEPRQVEAAVAKLVAITGRLDTVVASAGMAFEGSIMDITEER
jgi:NAD(P)-dependent dehydrogenase (short-subunit alcohol dehydrogenase family)